MKQGTEKPSIIKIIMITAGVVSALGGAVAFFIDYGTQKQEKVQYREGQKEVTFDDSKQKHDVTNLLDIEFHPLKLSKVQDSLTQQLGRVDLILNETYKQNQEAAKEKKTQDSINNKNETKRQKSREGREETIKEILDELILIKNDQRKIKKTLDTLN